MIQRSIRVVLKLGSVAAALALAGPVRQQIKPFLVYHDGANIVFTPEATGTRRLAKFGPWSLGERLGMSTDDKPMDKRLNLYVVLPGGQYRSSERPEYDHNLVMNKYPVDGKAREWDIIWCLALDPSLPKDLRSERELLMAAHQSFRPPETFALKDVASRTIMAERLHVTTVEALQRFRRKDGSLPRLLIVPAHLAVRATAELPPAGPPSPQ